MSGQPAAGSVIRATDQPYVTTFSGTTDSSGRLTITHGAPFTPSAAFAYNSAPGSTFAVFWGADNLGGVSVRTRWHDASGTGALASTAITGVLVLFK